MYFSMTCMVVQDDPEYRHFNIWNCLEEDVKLYYPEGLFKVIFDGGCEYEVCIKDVDFSNAFNVGCKLILEKINEEKSKY